MRTRRTRRLPALLAAESVLLSGATAVTLLHKQIHNGRRRTVTPSPATSRPGRNPARPHHTQSVQSVELEGLRWVGFHRIQLPISAHDGPHNSRGGLASGYSDTPTGALLAAINIGVRTATQWGPAIYRPTTQLISGHGILSHLLARR